MRERRRARLSCNILVRHLSKLHPAVALCSPYPPYVCLPLRSTRHENRGGGGTFFLCLQGATNTFSHPVALFSRPALTPKLSGKGADGSTDGVSVEEAEFPEAETYLLPLGACHGEDQQATEREGYRLPIKCQVHIFPSSCASAPPMVTPKRKIPVNQNNCCLFTTYVHGFACICV